MSKLRAYLSLAGKSDRKVTAVFATSPQACAAAVYHLRQGVPDLPVWLFTTTQPAPTTAASCERIIVESDSAALLIEAEKQLWPFWVALSISSWTGDRGHWPLKLAAFAIPPFRVLLMNEHGGFFAATPQSILRHVRARLRDAATSGWNHSKDIHRGIWLWFFALIAQRFTGLSRWAFRKWHGTQPLVVQVTQASGEDVAVFEYGHRQWTWTELDRLVRTSTDRYILFVEPCRTGLLACPSTAHQLFSDDDVFAVSLQTGFRDWKPALFATAPFRTLQPGEASQTLAPLSRITLVDREKLKALGVPKTIVPGTAWLQLYWKAAAAGWRCFSIGGPEELTETPDWPYEEAEFVTRILSDPALRTLGPREPDLSRGNISFAPGKARKLEDRPTVLIASPYLPYPLSHGGAVRIYNLCRALQSKVNFILASFREKNDTVNYDKLHEVFNEVYIVDRDEKAIKSAVLPRQVREHSSRGMRTLIAELCRTRKIDILQIEFTHMAEFREAAPAVPAILVEHDLTFTLYKQFAERSPGKTAQQEYERWLKFEQDWWTHYEAVWTMSGQDNARAIAEGSPAARTVVVSNGVDLDRFGPMDELAREQTVLYIGSFRHHPNILGFEKLWHEIMPRVWNRFPEVRLKVVAGPEPDRYWREFMNADYPQATDRRIQVHGFVEDVRPLYASSTLVAVPLLVSAGTNIKVVEAMACGRAVVTTPIGCVGLGLIDGSDAVIREEPEEFAAAMCNLLADRDLRRKISQQARQTVEERFGWSAIAESAYESYQRLL